MSLGLYETTIVNIRRDVIRAFTEGIDIETLGIFVEYEGSFHGTDHCYICGKQGIGYYLEGDDFCVHFECCDIPYPKHNKGES
ncbi:MAG: hypothetical protein ABIJ18_05895 [archaeon]